VFQSHYHVNMTSLDLALLYLLAAVLGVVVFRFMKLPAMLGYLLVGIVIGPNALALARDSAGIRYLAEFGVVFLMFVIGLEFNLPKLRSMRHLVFGLGLGQVLFTIVGALLGNMALVMVFSWVGMRRSDWSCRPNMGSGSWACCCSRIWPSCHCWC
jgi:CPA2 family monovalent cation:H+ antiporter-2